MGRPRKPAQVLELSGAFRKNPSRRRERAAELAIKPGIGDPPAEWIQGAEHNARLAHLLKLWNEIIAQDILRVLNVSHRALVETTCYLMYKVRQASAGYGKATSGDFARILSNLATMGMTPVDSPRVAEAVRVPDRGPGSAPASRSGTSWGEYVG